MQTIRQEIISLLSEEEHDARDLSKILGIRQKEVYDHLAHIARSVVPQGRKLIIIPARCLDCGYKFKERKRFNTPARCPFCKNEHIGDPKYQIV